MLDHFGLVVKDLERSVAFYEACLAPLGLKVIERHAYGAVIFARSETERLPFIWMGTGRPNFWNEDHNPGQSPLHLAFTAKSREAVQEFHRAALANGGTDNGAPDERKAKNYYYGAFVIDPDGNNIEAAYRE